MRTGKPFFPNIVFDKEGRYLLLHHKGAGIWYKANFVFLAGFLGLTVHNYVSNSAVFFEKKWFGKLYLGLILSGIAVWWLFSNRHIRCLYLLKGGTDVGIETYSNFGLTRNRLRILPISSLEGNRLFMSHRLNIYQLEYSYKSIIASLTKRRSFFYRPEFIVDQQLWKVVRTGNEVETDDVESINKEVNERKALLKKRK